MENPGDCLSKSAIDGILIQEEFGLVNVTLQQKYACHFMCVYLFNFWMCILPVTFLLVVTESRLSR